MWLAAMTTAAEGTTPPSNCNPKKGEPPSEVSSEGGSFFGQRVFRIAVLRSPVAWTDLYENTASTFEIDHQGGSSVEGEASLPSLEGELGVEEFSFCASKTLPLSCVWEEGGASILFKR